MSKNYSELSRADQQFLAFALSAEMRGGSKERAAAKMPLPLLH